MLFQSFLKIYFSFLFTSLLFVTTGFSQSTSYLDSLDGKFALQFQINENFRLSNFQGSTLSGKYHFSSRDAVRLGLSLSFSDFDGKVSSNVLDTINVNTNKIDNSSFGIKVNAQYIKYIMIFLSLPEADRLLIISLRLLMEILRKKIPLRNINAKMILIL